MQRAILPNAPSSSVLHSTNYAPRVEKVRRRWYGKSAAIALAVLCGLGVSLPASADTIQWDNEGLNLLWTTTSNWFDASTLTNDVPPTSVVPGDDLQFNMAVGTIILNGNQLSNSLTFGANTTLGAYGTTNILTDTTGNIAVNSGNMVTLNAAYSGPSLNLTGGGTLFMNNAWSVFPGNITVDGVGTTLLHRQEGTTVQYNGAGSAQEFGRFDQVSLGLSNAVKTITLTNGGTYKIFRAGNNPEGGFKNVVIGSGGGVFNIAAGYINQSLDDAGQIGVSTNEFTKAGKGRLILTGAGLAGGNPLGGIVNINGGMLSLDTIVSQTVGANTYNRFVGIAATGTTLNVNSGGTMFFNNGTQSFIDYPTINANDGSIIGINGQDHIFGYSIAGGVSTVTNFNINGTVNFLSRDLFNPQQERLPRFRSELAGSGILVVRGNTNSGGNPRLVIERNTSSAFNGTFRLMENMAIEANPRNMPTVGIGNVLGSGSVEFAGWASRLDVRDDTVGPTVINLTSNNLLVTSSQAGSVPRLAVNRNAGTATGNLINFGTLTLGSQRLSIEGANSYQAGVSGTATINGNATILMSSDNTPLVFSNAAAISEDAAGRSLTLLKTGTGTSAARDVIVGGTISMSNLQVATGSLILRGAGGAIGTGFGGAAPTITVGGTGLIANAANLPTAGLLHLDNNVGHVVGATTVFTAADNTDRIVNTATVNMTSNSTFRLTSLLDTGSAETIGITNVTGHATFDIVKTGTPPVAPVALTLTTLNYIGAGTANFTGTSLGTSGANSSRIVIPGTATGILSAQYHSANEWAKYDSTVDSTVEIGVTPFVAADYTIGSAETTWAASQQIKQNGATLPILTADRVADRFNFQTTATSTLDLAGFKLTADQGGIIASTNTIGFKDGATGAAPSGTAGVTAGTTASPANLYVYSNSTVEFHTPIIDNTAGGSVTFVKSGTGQVTLSHQNRAVGAGTAAISPYTGVTWSSTNTGGWVINDGSLVVHRGQYLGATPTTVTLNGGQLEIHEPVSTANADTIIPGWGHNIVVNGNAMLGMDDNGESADANTGDRTLVKLGSLTVNNGAMFGMAAYSDNDIAFMNGATLNGTPTFNIGGSGRSGTNNANILSGVVAGSGFNVTAFGGTATMILGGTQTDTAANTYNGTVTLYGSVLRLNKANGVNAITDGAASEDVIINGGTLAWGPGHHGDLATTNNINSTNNSFSNGIVPTSPATVMAAGMNQIADTATVTLLAGTLGEGDRINTETFGTLVQKNGTFNVGLGAIVINNSATITGGTINFDRSGSLKAGTLNLQPGAPDLGVTTGIPTGALTTLEVGAGGLSMTGQNITLGSGSSANVTGSGALLNLGGNVTATGTDLIGGSYGRKGIFVQIGSTFRQLGQSRIDLLGGTRDFNIDTDVIFTVTTRIVNGGISKSGGGFLVLEPYEASSFAGGVQVNLGTVEAKGSLALGTGPVTVASGGTMKLDSSWSYANNFTVAGPGALIPGGEGVREVGALVAVSGQSRINGSVTLAGNATLAGDTYLDPSVVPSSGGMAYRIGTLDIASAGGVVGSGNLTLSGPGDGIIRNGINTTAGTVSKDGTGRWTLSAAGTYVGATIVSAGQLRITNNNALGTTAAGTTVYDSGTLELSGGLSVAEPLTLSGAGASGLTGALVNLGGSNTLTGAITTSNATLRSDFGTLTINSAIAGGNGALTLHGAGTGVLAGPATLGPVASGDTFIKNGKGTWTVSATSSITGSTAVYGGTLNISAPGAVFDAAAPLNLAGGSINVTGGGQTVANINVLAGGGTLNGGATFNTGGLTRNPGATVNFAGTVTTTAATTNGILGNYATYANSDWATISGVNVVALTSYVPLSSAIATDNAIISSATTLAAPVAINTLKVAGGPGLAAGANNLIVNGGGVLYSGSGYAAISGTGLLAGPTVADELVVHTASGTLDLGIPLIGSGGGQLTKSGPGTLRLWSTSAFTGSINVNGGTLQVLGTTANPLGLLGGNPTAQNRVINLNGGAMSILADWDLNDYDGVTAGVQSLQFNIGPAGGTLHAGYGYQYLVNDPNQLFGSGDLTLVGGGRYRFENNFPNFTGRVTVNGGLLNTTSTTPLGANPAQTITLKTGSAIVSQTGTGLGVNGLLNNIVAETGTEFYAIGGSRVYSGDIELQGTHTIALVELDNVSAERQIYFNGRVTGAGVTLNVVGVNNGNPFYLASGSNPITGTINLNPNAVLEVRSPGSVGLNTGDVTVNLDTNSRLLLRHFQNGDYKANVVVNGHAEINSDRLTGFGAGTQQILSINNLTVNGDNRILTIGGANTYMTRVGGTATFNVSTNTILNVTASDLILENGLTFGTPASTLDKRGGFTAILRGPTNHTGKLLIQGGLVYLQDNGTLAGTTNIDLRGGELRVDNGNTVLADRLNDAATITLGGGMLRITGQETIGAVTAVAGTTQIIYNPTSETTVTALTLTGFTRQVGSVVQFQSPDLGPTTVGTATATQTRVSSRILLPGMAATTQTIPGMVGNNNLDFIQYSTTLEGGVALGVRDMRNPGSGAAFATNYTDNAAETAFSDSVILRRTNGTDATTVTYTLTANRGLDAIKIETGGTNRDVTFSLATFNLRIEGGGILDVAATTHDTTINGTTGVLTAGPATPGVGTAELFLGGTSTLSVVNAVIANNGTQPVAVVKTGPGTWSLNGGNTFTGGLYVAGGALNTTNPNYAGSTPQTITLAGGTLQFNIANASSSVDLGTPLHSVNVVANSQITLDNGVGPGTDNDVSFGSLTIGGPYTLRLFSFDSMDATFAGTHSFAGTPTLDMAQGTSGGNNQTGKFTLSGPITGSGFYVGGSGATNDTTSVLTIGGGALDTAPNTYSGKVTVLLGVGSTGSNSEDLLIELNKGSGVNAITGDLEINGGVVRNVANEQIANTSNIIINQGRWDLAAKNETITSLTMRGGNVLTNVTTGTGSPTNTLTITGALTVTGTDDLTLGSANGFTVGSYSTVTVGGLLSIGTYGRVHLAEGQTGAFLNVNGGLEMTGALLSQNSGPGANTVRLSSDVTTFASIHTSRLGNSDDSDTYTELNGTRTFTIADGVAGLDFALSSIVRDSTSPIAVGHLIKAGPGVMQLQGAANANTYSGTTTVNEGTLLLSKSAGTAAIPAGALTIGDGLGGAKADRVVVRNSNQIADANNVTIASSGVLDLQTFNTSETIASLTGTGAVDLGPGSVLTISSANNGNLSGSVTGGGSLVKGGTGIQILSGTNDYLGTTTVNANGGVLQFGKLVSLYNNVQANWNTTNIIVNSGGTLAVNVGGAGEFTATELDAVKALGSATGGFLPGSAFGIDTTNAVGTFTYASVIADTNGGANSVGFAKLGTGTLSLTGVNTYTGNTTVFAGKLITGDINSAANTTVAPNAELVANQIRQTTLTLQGTVANNTGKATVAASPGGAPGSTSGTSRVTTLAVANDGATLPVGPYTGAVRAYYSTLDLNNNDLIVNGTLADVNDLLRAGQGGTTALTWTGKGLTSGMATAAGAPSGFFGAVGLGAIRNDSNPATLAVDTPAASFSGVSGLTGDEILVKYTWYGDSNFDGQVTALDWSLLDAGWAGTKDAQLNQPSWYYGDYNLDGQTDSYDYALMVSGYTAFIGAPGAGGTVTLPEPSSLLLGGLGVVGLLAAFRRRQLGRK